MAVIKAVFVSARGLKHVVANTVVQTVTHSRYGHAAVVLRIDGADRLVEAVRPKVRDVAPFIYQAEPVLEEIEFEITDEQMDKAAEVAKRLIGLEYGLDDCAIGGIHDLLGHDIASFLCAHLDLKKTVDCSAVLTLIFRAVFPEFMEGENPAEVTPEQARLALRRLKYGEA